MAGKTFAQKILGKKAGKDVVPGEIVTISPDFIMSHDNTAAIYLNFKKLGVDRVKNPDKLVIVLDHVVPPSTEQYAKNHQTIRNFIKEQGIKHFYDINTRGGICHQVLSEKGYALPGTVIVGADSHTTTYGAFGAFSAGIGRSEVAVLWATDEIWMMVPETIKIVILGEIPFGVFAKDIMLYIIGQLGADYATYKAVEFSGPVIRELSIASRMVFSNMAVEMGAKAGYIEPDEKTLEYVKPRAKKEFEVIKSDPDADFEEVLYFSISDIEPQVAFPHTVDNVYPVSDASDVKVDQVFIGTCTNGRLEDLEIVRKIVKGKKIKDGVRGLVFPASWEVYFEAMKKNILYDIAEAGFLVMNPGCGPCLGAHEGVMAPGEVTVSTANRNFKGRMGSRDAFIYLASPATAAASALEGRIADPRKYLE